MKKLISLLLVLCCVFAVCSCDKIPDGIGDELQQPQGVAKIAAIVNSSAPTKITTFSDYIVSAEDNLMLNGRYYTTIAENGKKKFDFEYEKFAPIGSASAVETVSGSVLYNADGTVSEDNGATWTGAGAGYLPYSLNLNESDFKSFNISENGNNLSALISAEKSMSVFGVKIAATGDITLEVETNGTYLYYVNISYATENANVIIKTSYDYSAISLD